MKRYGLMVALVLATLGLSGCIVIHTEKVVPCRPAVVEPEAAAISERDAHGHGPASVMETG